MWQCIYVYQTKSPIPACFSDVCPYFLHVFVRQGENLDSVDQSELSLMVGGSGEECALEIFSANVSIVFSNVHAWGYILFPLMDLVTYYTYIHTYILSSICIRISEQFLHSSLERFCMFTLKLSMLMLS